MTERADWPDGPRSTTFINKLKNLELNAREQRRGLWDAKVFARTTGEAKAATETGKKSEPGPVDLNAASAEELQKLPGIGSTLAERIIAHRPYRKVDDLLKVSGIGPRNIERFRALVRVTGATAGDKE